MNTTTDYRIYLNQLDAIIKFSEKIFEALCIEDSKDGPYFTMMGLYASLLEQSKAFSILFHNKSFIATQAIARSLYEIFVDILNIKHNGNYVNYLFAEYHDRCKALCKKNSEKKKHRKKRNEAYKLYDSENDYKELSVYEKFKLIGFKEYYNSIYAYLSGHTHSGFNFILNRLDEGEKLNSLNRESLFKNEPCRLEISSIKLVSYCLKESSEIISKGHHKEAYDIVKEFFEDIENFFDNVS